MNQQLFETGYAAYQSGNWAAAVSALEQSKEPGEVSGRTDHLVGNALMQMGRYEEAAQAYGRALLDASYGMSGALNTNRGRAFVAAGRLPEGIEALKSATQDEAYATPYKAYMALGGACRATGDIRSAGIAFRNAAIDESNPNPSLALRKLGGCFMDLGRPADAVESYRTALDFSSDLQGQNAIYCDLALAYVASNRMSEAVDAFEHATADGTFVLSPEARASYEAAKNAVAARSGERRVSDTDDFLAAAGYGSYPVDPLDPTGETSGNLMPSPEDTGFFSVTEEEIMDDDRRRRRGRGGKILAVLLVIIVLLGAAGGFAYYNGFGWPMQENVVRDLFDARTSGQNVDQYLSGSLSDDERNRIEALVPKGATISKIDVKRSMSDSEVNAVVTLAEGGERSYAISMVRDGIGWKVSKLEPAFVSADDNLQVSSPATTSNNSTSTDSGEKTTTQETTEQTPAEETPSNEAPAEEGNTEAAADEGVEAQPADDNVVTDGGEV